MPDAEEPAVRDHGASGVDFADALSARTHTEAGTPETWAIDEKAAKFPGLRLPKS